MKRFIAQFGKDSTALFEVYHEAASVDAAQAEQIELNVTDDEWLKMRQQLKTGRLDFATVKKQKGNTGA